MLARKAYSTAEVAAARSSMGRWIGHVRGLPAEAAVDLVPALVIVLDAQFLHRMRGQEGKAAGPLKEVRTLAEAAVAGDPVDLDLDAFAALAESFYAEIESRFPPD